MGAQVLNFKKKEYSKNFKELYHEAKDIAFDVNHIVRVNGSSAFPVLPKSEKCSINKKR